MHRPLRQQIRFRLNALQSDNEETLFEQVCAAVARVRIHRNIKMSGFVAGHGDKGRDFENVPGFVPAVVGSRGKADGLSPDDSVVGACTLGSSDIPRKIRNDVREIHAAGPKPDRIYHFCESERLLAAPKQIELRDWCLQTYDTHLHIITGNTLADWLCDDDLVPIAQGLLGVGFAPGPGLQLAGIGDPDPSRPQLGSASNLYIGAGDSSLGRARITFTSLPAEDLIIRTLDPFQAHLVRKNLKLSKEEAVAAVWEGLPSAQQNAFALLEQAIFLTKREYLELLIPEHDWAGLLSTWKDAGWVSAKETGFYSIVDALRDRMASTDGLLDEARDRWLKVLAAHEGYCDLDLARCIHLFSAGDRDQAVALAHRTLVSVEDPPFLRLLGSLLAIIDVNKVHRQLSPHHRLLLDDAIGIHDLRIGRYPEAEQRFRAMLNRARRCGDDWGVAEALLHLGLTAHHAGDEAAATRWYRNAVKEARKRGQTFLLGRALHNLSQCLVSKDPLEADALLIESTKVRQQAGDESPFALWMANGLAAIEAGDAAGALCCFREAETTVGDQGYRDHRARALHNQANARLALGQTAKALRQGTEALALAREIEDPDLLRLAVQGQAVRLAQQGDYRSAMPLFDELVDLKDAIGDRAGKAIALSDSAVTRLKVGKTDAAMQRFVEARHIAEAADAEPELAFILRNHARGLRDSGDAQAATDLLSSAYRSAYDSGRWHLATDLARELADENHRCKGAIELRDAWYRKAIDSAHRAGDAKRIAFMVGQRMASLRDTNQLDAAAQAAQDLLDATRGNKALFAEYASACVEAGNLSIDSGDLDQAASHYLAGLKGLERQDDPRERARLLGNLGELERRRGNLDMAERHMRAALELMPAEDAAGRLHAMHNLALVLDGRDRRPEAIELLEQVRDRSKRNRDWEANAKAWIELGSIAWTDARPTLAMRRWQRALSIAEAQGLARCAVMASLGLARAHLDRGETTEALNLLAGRGEDPPLDLAANLAATHAQALQQQGRLEQAAAVLTQGIERTHRGAASDEQARLRSALALILGQQARFDDAWAQWETAIAATQTSEERLHTYQDGLELALKQDEGCLREEGRTSAVWNRIRKEPDRSAVRALCYDLAERLWHHDPEGATLVHFVTMTEGLSEDDLDTYFSDGVRLFLRLLRHPPVDALAAHIQDQVNFPRTDPDTRPPDELLFWPFRMAQRHLDSSDTSDEPSAELILQLVEAVWRELAAGADCGCGEEQ